MILLRATLIAVTLAVVSTASLGKDRSSLILYPVSGKTAPAVYESIKKNAPRVVRNATFAFTIIATKTDKAMAKSQQSCRYKSFRTSAIFDFVIPRHTDPNTLPPKTRAKWSNFVAYLRTHEAGHRTIWQNCFAEYDAQALALRDNTCDGLDRTSEKLFTAIKRKCLAADEAYDAEFRKAVLKEPFVAEALRKANAP
jgi:predicted secreted Zn-dependent protease